VLFKLNAMFLFQVFDGFGIDLFDKLISLSQQPVDILGYECCLHDASFRIFELNPLP
jgi:hypothetical protein